MCKLLFALVITLLLRFSAVQCAQTFGCTYDPNLDYSYYETSIGGVPALFSSPQYPENFNGGLGCRWQSDSPELLLSCAYGLPEHPTCDENTPDRIEVTTASGLIYYHCGSNGYIVLPDAILMEMKTDPEGTGGYFFCRVNTFTL